MADTSGYYAEAKVDADRDILDRNRFARWLIAGITTSLVLGLPTLGGHLLGTALEYLLRWEWLSYGTTLLSIGGFLVGVKLLQKHVMRMFIVVPNIQAFVAQDSVEHYYRGLLAFLLPKQDRGTGNMVVYGPGFHAAYPWEGRDEDGNFSLDVITQEFSFVVPTKDAAVTVSGSFQYKADLANLRHFAGIDESTINEGILALVHAFVYGKLSPKNAEEARTSLADLNPELRKLFQEPPQGDNTPSPKDTFESGYGIQVVVLVLKKIEFAEDVQKARGAVDEARQMLDIVAAMTGKTREEVKGLNPADYKELLDRALVTSGNATMNVSVVHGSLPAAVSAIVGKQLGNP